MATSKIAFGSKENIETAISEGLVDEYDVMYLSNGEIAWQDASNTTIINTPRTQTDIVVNGAEGLGVTDGDTIPAGLTLDELVTLLVQKSVPAEYTKPTVTLANNGGQAAGNVEAGTTVAVSLKSTFNQNDAGDLTSISILQGSTSVAEGTESPLTFSQDLVIGDESWAFKASASYDAAPVKQDNLGNDSTENWFDAGTVTSSTYTISGKRKAFYGAGVGECPELTSENIRALTGNVLNPTTSTTFSISVAVGQQYIIFAYPATLREVNQVMYVETNDTGMADSFTQILVDVADARGGSEGLTSYRVYSYTLATPCQSSMTMKVTI